MEPQGLEILTNRFASWSNLVSATAVLEQEGRSSQYDCNSCNSGCGGCGGCGDGIYLSQNKGLANFSGVKNMKEKAIYECQGCGGCNACSGCE